MLMKVLVGQDLLEWILSCCSRQEFQAFVVFVVMVYAAVTSVERDVAVFAGFAVVSESVFASRS